MLAVGQDKCFLSVIRHVDDSHPIVRNYVSDEIKRRKVLKETWRGKMSAMKGWR